MNIEFQNFLFVLNKIDLVDDPEEAEQDVEIILFKEQTQILLILIFMFL